MPRFLLPLFAALAFTACQDTTTAGGTVTLSGERSNGGATGVAFARATGNAVALTSAQRRARGLGSVQSDARLARAAQVQANWMAKNGVMTHTGPGGTRMADRIRATGYKPCFAAENIAFGQPSVNAVMSSWMGSSGHRKNILHNRATEAAVASAVDGVGQTYWVMLLADPC
ncbi:MAG: CAP domain-containing protein [Pseudomonadota bacterium]